MPRTVTPEEQQRVDTISELKTVKPTPERKVFVDSDADGEPNIFLWDPSGEASNADGTTIIESGLAVYGNEGTKEGVWRRFRLPFSAATTDDLTEGTENLYYTSDRVKNDLSAGGDITYTANTGQDGTPAEFSLDVSSLSASDLFGSKTTDDLPEGGSNLYFTDERAQDAIGSIITGSGRTTVTYNDNDAQGDPAPSIVVETTDEAIQDAVYENVLSGTQTRINVTYDDANGEVDYVVNDDLSLYDFSNVSTDDLQEGSQNLYFTGTRVREEFKAGGDITYDNGFDTAYGLDIASFTGEFDTTAEESVPEGIEFNGDGTKMFIAGTQNNAVQEYELTTPYDVSSGVIFSGNSFNVSVEVSGTGLEFNGDGTKMFAAGGGGTVASYSLSTGFDLSSTVSSTGNTADLSTEVSGLKGIEFNGDGTKLFATSGSGGSIYEYVLGTAYDLTTLTYSGNSFDVTSQASDAANVVFNGDGTEMIVLSFQDSQAYKYSLGSAFDLSSAVTDTGERLDTSAQKSSGPLALEFDGNGENLFVTVNSFGVLQYDTGDAPQLASFNLDVSELSASDLFGSKTTNSLPEGNSNLYYTDERAQDAVGTAMEGANGVTVTYDDANDTITVDASASGPSVSDDGNEIVPGATEINFSTGLEVADDGDGTVTVSSLSRFGTATFSADGSSLQFEINHGLNNEPEAFVLQPKSDDASALSHATADSNTITAIYDSPPPSGTDNVVIDYSLKKQ